MNRVILALTLIALLTLTLAGFVVSWDRLFDFFLQYGNGDVWSATLSASIIDSLGLIGAATALWYKNGVSRASFIFALLFSAGTNAFVGFVVAGPLGIVAALAPFIALELSYRLGLTLTLASKELRNPRVVPVKPPETAESSQTEDETKTETSAKSEPQPRKGPKLSFEIAEEIRNLHREGETQKALAERFEISTPTVSQIIANQRWKAKDPVA